MKIESIIDKNKSLLSTIWSILSHTFRFFRLFFIFFPVIILYPFRNVSFVRNLWLNLLVSSVERAGVVWIKAFQYMSHRRDIIGPDMADKFVHLR
jgi:predicted unusual protein kinase regulating ubiquinone biosynthesis (AarF/ABC1/UbiB family)